MKNNIFFLIGPTASGKSKLALRMAQDYPFEIINADIFSFYKGLNIAANITTISITVGISL